MCKQIYLPITNYAKFIVNQYQEEGQEPAHTATPKKQYSSVTRWWLYIPLVIIHTEANWCNDTWSFYDFTWIFDTFMILSPSIIYFNKMKNGEEKNGIQSWPYLHIEQQ